MESSRLYMGGQNFLCDLGDDGFLVMFCAGARSCSRNSRAVSVRRANDHYGE